MYVKDGLKFVNTVTKQGNSYSIRVPKFLFDKLGLSDGESVSIKLNKINYSSLMPKVIAKNLEEARNCKELDNYSEEKKILFVTLNAHFGEKIAKNIGDSGKISELIKVHHDNIKKEFGQKILDEYTNFMTIFSEYMEKTGKAITEQY